MVGLGKTQLTDIVAPICDQNNAGVSPRADLAVLLDAFNDGQMSVASVVGEPGLGKSRLIREFASRATHYGAETVVTQCESHTANVPLRALSRMLRAMFGIHRLDAATARAHIAAQLAGVVEAGSGDSFVLFDLLGIGDSGASAQTMSADARRHRLIEVMGKFAKARPARTLYIVEDLHWVDAASEEVFAKFTETLTATQSMFVGSYRPEYHGRLREVSETTIVLAGYAKICHAVPRPGRRTRCSRTPRDRESAPCCISRGLRRAHASVARMQTVTYGSARPVALASAGWVASSSRTRASVWVRTSAGEVMQ